MYLVLFYYVLVNCDAIESCLNYSVFGIRTIYDKAEYVRETHKHKDDAQRSDFIFSMVYE